MSPNEEIVTIVEFNRPASIYRTGDRAGFSPQKAQAFVNSGAARIVKENVPRVSAETRLHHARVAEAAAANAAGSAADTRRGSPSSRAS